MTTATPDGAHIMTSTAPHSTKVLLPYFLTATAISITTQVLILVGTDPRLTTYFGVGILAALYAGFLIQKRTALPRIRFGRYVAHAMTYAIVNVPIFLGALAAVKFNWESTSSDALFQVTVGLSMAGFWGIGLILHTFGAIMSRGFEDQA